MAATPIIATSRLNYPWEVFSELDAMLYNRGEKQKASGHVYE